MSGREGFELDPELEECLRDLAARPNASLFEFDPRELHRRDVRSILFARGEGEAGLMAVEREILTSHRLELAYLLRVLFVDEVQRHAYSGPRQYFVGKLPSREDWEAQARERMDQGPVDSAAESAVEVLRRAIGEGGRRPSLLHVARASLALQDCATARVYMAQALMAEGQWRSARETLEHLLTEALEPIVRKCALAFFSETLHRAGHEQEAVTHFARSAKESIDAGLGYEIEVPALVHTLLYSVVQGRAEIARWACDSLDERARTVDEVVRSAIDSYELKTGHTKSTVKSSEVRTRLNLGTDGTSSEVLRECF